MLKNGRETGGATAYPSRASAPLYKGIPSENGRKGGTFLTSRPVRLTQTSSPKASDSQSVGSGLAVRKDGLQSRD